MKMILHLYLYTTLLFFFCPGLSVSQCNIKVKQPQSLYGRINQSISIPCNFSTTCSSNKPDVQWYVFRTDSSHQLDIKSLKYRLDGADLHINGLSQSDDGVYHCAVSDKDSVNSGAQAIGPGTTLTVKANGYNAGQVLLIILVVFLSLYSLIILTVFIGIKIGRVPLLKQRQGHSQDKGDSSKKVNFGAVVQEMCNKRNLQRNKKKRSTDVSQENKVENPEKSRTEKEDIYQNLKRAR